MAIMGLVRVMSVSEPGLENEPLPNPNALSIDLEDWYHPELVRRYLKSRPACSRVVQATMPLLDLLARCGVCATFFVVGEVMRQHPNLVRHIYAQGHEIACHGMTHRPLWELTPAAFAAELSAFASLSREVLGADVKIHGFRAPTFSLDRRTGWAISVLQDMGYTYDSSVFPVRGPLYGVPTAPINIYPLSRDDPAGTDPTSPLLEFPLPTFKCGGWRVPIGGGVYLRLLPAHWLIRMLKRSPSQHPFVLYLHPWETDPTTPRVKMPAWARFATYHGLDTALQKLSQVLEAFSFTTVHDTLQHWQTRHQPQAPGLSLPPSTPWPC